MKVDLKEVIEKADAGPMTVACEMDCAPMLKIAGFIVAHVNPWAESFGDRKHVYNAALLAHRWNTHQQLLDALKEMVWDEVEGPFFHEDEHASPDCALQKARAAIKAASSVEID